MKISNVRGRELLDSRGHPTIEVEIQLDNGFVNRFAVPSGASTGSLEAHELRDGDKKRYAGKGVTKAVANVNGTIRDALLGLDPTQQKLIDSTLIKLDGSKNKNKLGANAILGASVACAKVAACALGMSLHHYIGGTGARQLPVPMMNIVNGGGHADNNLDIQELMIMPVGAANLREAVRMGSEVFHTLKQILKEAGKSTGVGDEGGFAPEVKSNEEGLALIVKAIKKAGYKPGTDICLAMDAAANEFRTIKNGQHLYTLKAEQDFVERSAADLVKYYEGLVKKYFIISIEDGMAEDDWDGWKLLTKALGQKIQIVGDDLFVTNVIQLRKGFEAGVANSILIKLNQIGTLTETLWTIETAKRHNFTCIISHRSAEAGESVIASLAVACNAGQIKTGSLCRGERTTNYNELMRIEEELGDDAVFEGKNSIYCVKL